MRSRLTEFVRIDISQKMTYIEVGDYKKAALIYFQMN